MNSAQVIVDFANDTGPVKAVTGVDGPLFLRCGEKTPAFETKSYGGPKPEAVSAEGKFACRPI